MQKARRGFPPRLHTEISDYAFLHESCFSVNENFRDRSHKILIVYAGRGATPNAESGRHRFRPGEISEP
jgi:hypothetical protein